MAKKKEQAFNWAECFDDFVWNICDVDDPRCRVFYTWDDQKFSMRPVVSLFDKNFDPDNIPEDYHYSPEVKRQSDEFHRDMNGKKRRKSYC